MRRKRVQFSDRLRLQRYSPPTFLHVNVVAPVHHAAAAALELERGDSAVIRVFDGARRQPIISVLAVHSVEAAYSHSRRR